MYTPLLIQSKTQHGTQGEWSSLEPEQTVIWSLPQPHKDPPALELQDGCGHTMCTCRGQKTFTKDKLSLVFSTCCKEDLRWPVPCLQIFTAREAGRRGLVHPGTLTFCLAHNPELFFPLHCNLKGSRSLWTMLAIMTQV